MKIESGCCTATTSWCAIKAGEVAKSVTSGWYYIKSSDGSGVRLSDGQLIPKSNFTYVEMIKVNAKVVIG